MGERQQGQLGLPVSAPSTPARVTSRPDLGLAGAGVRWVEARDTFPGDEFCPGAASCPSPPSSRCHVPRRPTTSSCQRRTPEPRPSPGCRTDRAAPAGPPRPSSGRLALVDGAGSNAPSARGAAFHTIDLSWNVNASRASATPSPPSAITGSLGGRLRHRGALAAAPTPGELRRRSLHERRADDVRRHRCPSAARPPCSLNTDRQARGPTRGRKEVQRHHERDGRRGSGDHALAPNQPAAPQR